jgi:hypothetical protein
VRGALLEIIMPLSTYLMLALLVAACIPLLNVIASWYYLRFAKGVPAFGLTVPWARSVTPERPMPQSTQAEDSFVNEGGRASCEPNTTRLDTSGMPAETDPRMKELAIGFDGRQYTFSGYRDERLSDATN